MRTIIANAPCIVPLDGEREKYFIRAGSRWPFSVIKDRSQAVCEYVPFPFYMAYSTALLEKDGMDVTAIDAIPLNYDDEQFFQQVASKNPDLVVLESTTPTFDSDLRLIKRLKHNLGCRVVLSGSHVTTFPEETMEQQPDVDFILMGEYEQNLQALVRALDKNRENPDLNGLMGVGARLPTGVYLESSKAIIQDLDSLPFPAWHQFPSKETANWNYYWDNICQMKPAAQMHSSRGCPFRCNFCVWISVMYDHSRMRFFSPGRICDEMEELHRRSGIREIYFDDDNFTGNKKHVLELCQEMNRRGIRDRIKWSVMGDAMVCDEEMMDAMADAGCIAMKFGVESGDEQILKNIKKPVDLAKAKRMASRAADRGVKTHATFSVGLLGETRETMQRTLEYAKAIDIDTLQVSITTPFPGTSFYDEAREKGLLVSESWHDFDGQNSAIVRYENLSNEEIQTFASRFASTWLWAKVRQPRWVLRQLKMFARIFKYQGFGGLKQIIKAGFRVLFKKR